MLSMWSQLGLQDAFSPVSEEFLYFHDYTNTILLFILVMVGGLMAQTPSNKIIHKSLLEGQTLEAVWTLLPALVLSQIALPSLVLLYTLEEFTSNTSVTIKVTAHQWYWSYGFPQFLSVSGSPDFDSFMVTTSELEPGNFRLLEVDNRLTIPALTPLRFLITSADVLHAWAVPSLGLKVDAVPGRLNQLATEINCPGVFYGQCSEICGANHSFMPINVESVPLGHWLSLNTK